MFSKYLLILFLLFSFLEAQDIKKEIMNYKDPDNIIILKARKRIFDNLKRGDIEKVKEVYQFLNKEYNNYPIQPLNFNESLLIKYWIQDYKGLLDLYEYPAMINVSLFQKDHFFTLYGQKPWDDFLLDKLEDYSRDEYAYLVNSIKKTNYSREEKDYLLLFFEALVTQGYNNYQNDINYMTDNYLSSYPDSKYNGFIRHYIRYVEIPSDWGYSLEFAGGYGMFDGSIKNYLRGGGTIGLAADIQYKSFITYLRLLAFETKVKNEFEYKGTWKKDLPVEFVQPEISFGYPLIESRLLKIVPFAGFIITHAASTGDESKQEGNDVSLGTHFGYTTGLTFDFKLAHSSCLIPPHRSNELLNDFTYVYLRLRAGYSITNFNKYQTDVTGNLIYLTFSIGFYSKAVMSEN